MWLPGLYKRKQKKSFLWNVNPFVSTGKFIKDSDPKISIGT
jgi:hypothetical protein